MGALQDDFHPGESDIDLLAMFEPMDLFAEDIECTKRLLYAV